MPAVAIAILNYSPAAVSAQTSPAATQEEGTMRPEVAVRNEDYAVMRQRFRTKLTKPGRVPIKVDNLIAPSSVRVIKYQSGDLDLRAWMDAALPPRGSRRPAVVFLHGG